MTKRVIEYNDVVIIPSKRYKINPNNLNDQIIEILLNSIRNKDDIDFICNFN